MSDGVPEQFEAMVREEGNRQQRALVRAMETWPNFAKRYAVAMLGNAVAVCDCLGVDVEAFLIHLRQNEPKPDFVFVPDPKARS